MVTNILWYILALACAGGVIAGAAALLRRRRRQSEKERTGQLREEPDGETPAEAENPKRALAEELFVCREEIRKLKWAGNCYRKLLPILAELASLKNPDAMDVDITLHNKDMSSVLREISNGAPEADRESELAKLMTQDERDLKREREESQWELNSFSDRLPWPEILAALLPCLEELTRAAQNEETDKCLEGIEKIRASCKRYRVLEEEE